MISISISIQFAFRWRKTKMALSEFDRNLLDRCLQKQPQAWNEFVDRFAGLISFVVRSVCQDRGLSLDLAAQEDLIQEVFVVILSENFVVLRRFRGNCSLAAYLTVIARRVVVRVILQKYVQQPAAGTLDGLEEAAVEEAAAPEELIENMDEVLFLISRLPEREAKIVKMYHLEQRSYAEIAESLSIPVNTVGPTLSRAREVMRQRG
ncbi:MAG: sigma-70 family RNA polymerase sigma factor [Planctomycetaceae bacterium]|nr:sigma-70 family RNA polymerase sigma factor [Planctomycetaceae bacterium]